VARQPELRIYCSFTNLYATTSSLLFKDGEALKKQELIQKHGLQQDEIRKQVSV
jgi:hypothetical protein